MNDTHPADCDGSEETAVPMETILAKLFYSYQCNKSKIR